MQVIFLHSPVDEYFPTQQASISAVDFTLDAAWCPLVYLGSITLPGESIGSPRLSAQSHRTATCPIHMPVTSLSCLHL